MKSIGAGRFVIVAVVVVVDIAAADGTMFCGRCVIIHRRVRIGICCLLLSLELVLVYSNPRGYFVMSLCILDLAESE